MFLLLICRKHSIWPSQSSRNKRTGRVLSDSKKGDKLLLLLLHFAHFRNPVFHCYIALAVPAGYWGDVKHCISRIFGDGQFFTSTKSETWGNEKCPWKHFPCRYPLESFCEKSPRTERLSSTLSLILPPNAAAQRCRKPRKTRVYLARVLLIYLISPAHRAECARRYKPGHYRNDTKRTESWFFWAGCSPSP